MTRVCVLIASLVATAAQAQTPVNATSGIAFSASPDHNLDADGVPIVDHYQYDIVHATGLFVTVGLAKPPPNPNGVITVDPMPAFGTLVVGVVYSSTVSAVGPGGAGVSPPSDPFVKLAVGPGTPRSPGKPALLP